MTSAAATANWAQSAAAARQERPQRTASANRAQLEFQLRKTVPTAKVLSAPRHAWRRGKGRGRKGGTEMEGEVNIFIILIYTETHKHTKTRMIIIGPKERLN